MCLEYLIPIFTAITAVATSYSAYYLYKRPRLEASISYRQFGIKKGFFEVSVQVKRKGRVAIAKNCYAKWEIGEIHDRTDKMDLETSESFTLFYLRISDGKLELQTSQYEGIIHSLPLSKYKDKTLKVTVTSENAEGRTRQICIRQIIDKINKKSLLVD